MATVSTSSHAAFESPQRSEDHGQRQLVHHVTRYAMPVGRVLFALIFLIMGPLHFTASMVLLAQDAGVPMANLFVPLAGVMAMVGGASVALGFKARLGALLLVAFLVPVTLAMHNFWAVTDAQQAMLQQTMFIKNLALIGGALILVHMGAGPISLDQRRFRTRNERAYRESQYARS